MCSRNTARSIGKIGLLLTAFFIFALASDAAAQCYCKKKRSISYRRAHPTKSYSSLRTIYYTPPSAAYAANPATPAVYAEPVKTRSVNYSEYDADYYDTRRIGMDFGFRDGLKRGMKVGLSRKHYYPEKNHHYNHPTNGYKSRYGSKAVFKEGYRDGYLKGYRTGFRLYSNKDSRREPINY